MNKLAYFLLVFATVCTFQANAKQITINSHPDDCVAGLSTMDVTVQVEGERFYFRPYCNDWFNEYFKMSDGTRCRVQAGMCTQVTPAHKIEVECDGSFTEFVDVDCP